MSPESTDSQLIEVRRSNVHGLGVFALQQLPLGKRRASVRERLQLREIAVARELGEGP